MCDRQHGVCPFRDRFPADSDKDRNPVDGLWPGSMPGYRLAQAPCDSRRHGHSSDTRRRTGGERTGFDMRRADRPPGCKRARMPARPRSFVKNPVEGVRPGVRDPVGKSVRSPKQAIQDSGRASWSTRKPHAAQVRELYRGRRLPTNRGMHEPFGVLSARAAPKSHGPTSAIAPRSSTHPHFPPRRRIVA